MENVSSQNYKKSALGVSVVIITRNRLAKLRRCVTSVISILYGAEVIVIDNGSDDGTQDYLLGLSAVRGIFLNSNVGVAKARNIGLKAASGPYVMLLDDDAWLEAINLEDIKKYFSIHPKTGIIAPRLLYPDGTVQESLRSFPTISALSWRGARLYRHFPNVSWYKRYVVHDTDRIHEADWAIGACQIMRKKLLENCGYLDEKYYFGYEDAEFCRRVKKLGYSTVYWPNATVYHEYQRSSSKIFNMSFFRHTKSIMRFFLSDGNRWG